MICSSTIGTGISGTLRYIRGQGRDENGKLKQLPANGKSRARLLGGQGFGFVPRDDRTVEIARRMMEHNGRPEMQASQNKYCAKDALHMSLSWARSQTPADEEKIEACKEFLKALDMENAQALYYSHDDKSHSHVHVVASRINPETRKAYDDYQRFYKGARRAIEWEREKNQITKERQWCHDWANAVEAQNHDRLKELMFKNDAIVRKTKLDLALALGGKLGNELEAAREAFVQRHKLLRLKKYQGGRTAAYTTEEIWKEENQILKTARQLHERKGLEIPEEILNKVSDRYTLSEEQRGFLRHMASDRGLALGIGQAGTGKSHEYKAFRDACKEAGYKPRFLSTTNQVVNDARLDGHDAYTIASEVERLKFGHHGYDDKTVIMPDEASMMDHSGLNELLWRANMHGAKVRPVGDPRQLGSVPRGGMFDILAKRYGAARLNEIMRNKDLDQKRAWNHMHERQFKKAVDLFKKSESIRWNDNQEASQKALIEDYTKDFIENPERTQHIVAMSNDEVDKLNEFARELRKEHGKIGPDKEFDTAKGPKKFGVGDRIAIKETSAKYKAKGLVNGAMGTVSAIDGQDISFKTDPAKNRPSKEIKFTVGKDKENGQIDGIQHGYASTAYSSQGKSIDRTYFRHDPRSTAPTNYVGLTRHIDRTRLYASREETNGYEHLADQLKQGYDKTAAHKYILDEEDRKKLDQQPERRAPTMPKQNLHLSAGDLYEQHARERFKELPLGQRIAQAAKASLQGVSTPLRDRLAASRELFMKAQKESEQMQERTRTKTMYRQTIDRLFSSGETKHEESHEHKREQDRGEAQRNLRDTTDATKPGLIVRHEPDHRIKRDRSRGR